MAQKKSIPQHSESKSWPDTCTTLPKEKSFVRWEWMLPFLRCNKPELRSVRRAPGHTEAGRPASCLHKHRAQVSQQQLGALRAFECFISTWQSDAYSKIDLTRPDPKDSNYIFIAAVPTLLLSLRPFVPLLLFYFFSFPLEVAAVDSCLIYFFY